MLNPAEIGWCCSLATPSTGLRWWLLYVSSATAGTVQPVYMDKMGRLRHHEGRRSHMSESISVLQTEIRVQLEGICGVDEWWGLFIGGLMF